MINTSKLIKPVIAGIILGLLLTSFMKPANAQTCVPPPSGLISWWDADSVSGTTVDDISNGNNGILLGGATTAPGKVGAALSFDGTDDTVEIPHNGNLKPSTQITIEAWVQPDDVTATLREIYRKEDGNDRTLLAFQSGGFCNDGGFPIFASPCLAFGISTSSGNYRESHAGGTIIGNLTDGDFHHIAATYDGSSRKIYVDGNLVDSVADSGSIGISGTSNAYIGSAIGQQEFFDGRIDEIGIYNRALSASEIAGIYSADAAGKCKFTSVNIDIKPGSDPNSINLCSNGTIPVAIFGSASLNVYDINTDSLRFAEASVKIVGKKDPKSICSYSDINGDLLDDLVCHYETTDIAALGGESTSATVNGELFDNTAIEGSDSVNIVKDSCQ